MSSQNDNTHKVKLTSAEAAETIRALRLYQEAGYLMTGGEMPDDGTITAAVIHKLERVAAAGSPA